MLNETVEKGVHALNNGRCVELNSTPHNDVPQKLDINVSKNNGEMQDEVKAITDLLLNAGTEYLSGHTENSYMLWTNRQNYTFNLYRFLCEERNRLKIEHPRERRAVTMIKEIDEILWKTFGLWLEKVIESRNQREVWQEPSIRLSGLDAELKDDLVGHGVNVDIADIVSKHLAQICLNRVEQSRGAIF